MDVMKFKSVVHIDEKLPYKGEPLTESFKTNVLFPPRLSRETIKRICIL